MINSSEYLPHLVRFRLARLALLYIHPWIALPRRFVNGMARTLLARFSEEMSAYRRKIGITHVLWGYTHFLKDFVYIHALPLS
jgi:hypothetical protein